MKCISVKCKDNSSNVLVNIDSYNNVYIRDDIVSFLKNNSGGYPIKNVVMFDNEEYEIRAFLSLDEQDKHYFIEKPLKYFLNKTKGKIIPIGLDSGSNYYCVNNDTGKVYFWCSEEDVYYLIAESLNDFVEIILNS